MDCTVQHIYATEYAFAALKADGSVVSWGSADWGDDLGYTKVQGQLAVDVQRIYSTNCAFLSIASITARFARSS